MLRHFFFGNSEAKRSDEAPEIEDDQPRNKFNEIHILCGHTDLVDSLINIDNSRVLSIGEDKRAILWDCIDGEILYELGGHTRVITSAFYLQNYIDNDCLVLDAIVTASLDQSIKVWDLTNGQCRKIVKEHEGTVKCFCLTTSEPAMIVSGGEDICLWNLSFELLAKLKRDSLDYVHTIICIKPHRIVAATDQPVLMVYNICEETSFPDELHEIKHHKRLPTHRESVTFVLHISDSRFASASMDGTISIWSSQHLQVLCQFNNYENFINISDHTYPYKVSHLVTVDETYIIAAIGCGFAIYDCVYDQVICRVVKGHHSPVTCITLLSNGSYLATSSLDGTVRLWAVPITSNYEEFTDSEDVSCMARLFGIRTLDHRSYPLKLQLVGMCCAHPNSVKSMVDCGKEGFISCGNDGLIVLWKDSEILHKVRDEQLRKVLHNIGWLNH